MFFFVFRHFLQAPRRLCLPRGFRQNFDNRRREARGSQRGADVGQSDDRLRFRAGRLDDDCRRRFHVDNVDARGLRIHGSEPLQESHRLVGAHEEDDSELRR